MIHPDHNSCILVFGKTWVQEGEEVIGVDEYDRIRYLFAVKGVSQRAIARMLGVSRNTVKKYCRGEHLPGERKPARRYCKTTGPVRDVVAQWLEEDKLAPRKQRHTARRVYDRLVKECGFQGGRSTIRRLVREIRPKDVAYIPLEFDPGDAAQVDWGEATVIVAGEKRKAHLFCMRLCYSGAGFVAVFPTDREHAFLEGHKQAFEFFGGVARRAIYEYVPRNIFQENYLGDSPDVLERPSQRSEECSHVQTDHKLHIHEP